MPRNKFADTGAKSVLELLQLNSRFKVPQFQRNYDWRDEQVEALWEDLTDNFRLVKDNPKNILDYQYLLGPIVLVDTKDAYYQIIDGQQRLATLTMLFCVARDIILEDTRKEGKQPEGIEKILEMIENTHMGKWEDWKLELNDVDKDLFEEILKYEIGKETQLERMKKKKKLKSSRKYLRDNYVFLHEKITEALYSDFEKEIPDKIYSMSEDEKRKLRIDNHSSLLYFIQHVKENNYLIQVMVSDDSTAFQIFETLNQRGKTLLKSNLIKNHILNKIDDGPQKKQTQKEQSDKWNGIFTSLGDRQPDDDFIMESYHSRLSDQLSLREKHKSNRPMSKKNLYKIVKNMVDNEEDCKQFIIELKEDAEFLVTINDPSNYTDETSRDDIRSLNALDAKFIRIPILAAYRRWYNNDKEQDYSDLVKLLVKFFFKVRVVREKHPGWIEKNMKIVTQMINEDKSFDEIRKYIIDVDDHENFKNDFTQRFIEDPGRAAKYALQQITMHLGTKHEDVKPIDDLTLEHILPQEGKKWNRDEFFKDIDNDEYNVDNMQAWALTLGNMTLLKKSINARLSNLTFKKKRDLKDKNGEFIGYMGSGLHINKKTVCNHDEWTAKIILEREEEFARYADEIWKLD